MKNISRTFLTGVATIVPVVGTIYVLWWLEDRSGTWLEKTLPGSVWDFPGAGILVGLVLIYLVGFLMRIYAVGFVFRLGERVLHRIPLVKTLYGSLRDLMGFFVRDEDGKQSQVVMVTLPGTGLRLIGLLTRDEFSDIPAGIGTEDTVAVYLPMSYQIGGFTVMLPRAVVEPIDMSMEDAMRFAVTAGMTQGEKG
jgi:uncharacterized membrane protein